MITKIRKMKDKKVLPLFIISLCLLMFTNTLFFSQLLREFYASSATVLISEFASNKSLLGILFLGMPYLYLFKLGNKVKTYKIILITSIILCFSRLLVLAPLGAEFKLIISSIGVGSFLSFLPALFKTVYAKSNLPNYSRALYLYMPFGTAILADFFLRTMGTSFDISLYGYPPFYPILHPMLITSLLIFLQLISLYEYVIYNYKLKYIEYVEVKKETWDFYLSAITFGALIFLFQTFFFHPDILTTMVNVPYSLVTLLITASTCASIFFFWNPKNMKALLNLPCSVIMFIQILALIDILFVHSAIVSLSIMLFVFILFIHLFFKLQYLIEQDQHMYNTAKYVLIVGMVNIILMFMYMGSFEPLAFLFKNTLYGKQNAILFIVSMACGLYSARMIVTYNKRADETIDSNIRNKKFTASCFSVLLIMVAMQLSTDINSYNNLNEIVNLRGSAENNVKIVSYNLQNSNLEKSIIAHKRILNFVLRNNVDVIGLQDTGGYESITRNVNLLTLISKALGLKAITHPHDYRSDMKVTTFTPHDVLLSQIISFSNKVTTKNNKLVRSAANQSVRSMSHNLINLYGEEVSVYNVSIPESLEYNIREQQYMIDTIKIDRSLEKNPIILIGELNIPQDSEIVTKLQGLFPTVCFNGHKNYIVATEEFQLEKCEVIANIDKEEYAPLKAEFSFR